MITFTNTSLSQTYLIEGIRGSGKTVLMTTIAKELKSNKDSYKKGYIESPKHGYISLTLPRLNEVFKKYA